MATDHEGRRTAVKDAFRFLSASKPTVSGSRPQEALTFVSEPLFIDVEIDERDGLVSVLIGSLRPDGNVPDGYYEDSSGSPVRWHLGNLLSLIGRGEAAARLRAAYGKTGDEAMEAQIEESAGALETHLLEVIAALTGPDRPQSLH